MLGMRSAGKASVCTLVLCILCHCTASAQTGSALNDRFIDLYREGKVEEAISMAETLLSQIEGWYGKNDPRSEPILNSLGLLYEITGNLQQAIFMYNQLLSLRITNLGAGHPLVAIVYAKLAEIEGSQGPGTAARRSREYWSLAIKIAKDFSGPSATGIDETINALAKICERAGERVAALKLYQYSLSYREATFGSSSLAVDDVLTKIASVTYTIYSGGGIPVFKSHREDPRLFDAVEPIHMRSLKIRESHFGPMDLSLVSVLNELGGLYMRFQRYPNSIAVYERALAIQRKALGSDHPDVGATLDSISEVRRRENNLDEAEQLLKQALAIKENALGTDHPDVATTLNSLARLYVERGRKSDAGRLRDRAGDIDRRARQEAREPAAVTQFMKNISQRSEIDKERVPPNPCSAGWVGQRLKLEAGQTVTATAERICTPVRILFGTNRKRQDPANAQTAAKRISYLPERGRELELGLAVVTVPRTAARSIGEVTRPSWWEKLGFKKANADDPTRYFTIPENGIMITNSAEEFANIVRWLRVTTGAFRTHAFVFVHGYNTSFDAALFRVAQLAYDLGTNGAPFGIPFLFSWPSAADPKHYVYDEERVRLLPLSNSSNFYDWSRKNLAPITFISLLTAWETNLWLGH
jgi:tetratricopeptide (TPR) repeat protein